MAYNLKYIVIKDLPEKPEYSSSTLEQEYLLSGGEFLENLNLSIDEIIEICKSKNITPYEYLSEIEPNIHFDDCYLYPKMDGDAAQICLVDTLTDKDLIIINFELINFEKTQILHEKLEKRGKNLNNSKLIPVIDGTGKKKNLPLTERDKKDCIFIDHDEYKRNYVSESQAREQNNEKFEVLQVFPKREVNLTVEEVLSVLGL